MYFNTLILFNLFSIIVYVHLFDSVNQAVTVLHMLKIMYIFLYLLVI